MATARPVGVTAQQIDRPDAGGVLAAHQRETLADRGGVGGQQLLQVGLDAVLLEARVDAELVGAVVQYLLERMVRVSPLGLVTTQRSSSSSTVLGAFIQFSGL